jgi:hypothetical protein
MRCSDDDADDDDDDGSDGELLPRRACRVPQVKRMKPGLGQKCAECLVVTSVK